jgi:hypothetical protein
MQEARQISFSVVPQPNSILGRLIIEVSRPHTIRHIHAVGPLWTSDQLVGEDATYKTHNKQKTCIYALSGIRNRSPGSRAAADLCLKPYGHILIICSLLWQTGKKPTKRPSLRSQKAALCTLSV